MKGTEVPKHKPLRGKPQINGIRNCMRDHGTHNPRTNPNDLNYTLEIRNTIIRDTLIRM